MKAKITGSFTNWEGKERKIALAESMGKKRTGFGYTDQEAIEAAKLALTTKDK
jgi:hypothetical protein